MPGARSVPSTFDPRPKIFATGNNSCPGPQHNTNADLPRAAGPPRAFAVVSSSSFPYPPVADFDMASRSASSASRVHGANLGTSIRSYSFDISDQLCDNMSFLALPSPPHMLLQPPPPSPPRVLVLANIVDRRGIILDATRRAMPPVAVPGDRGEKIF
jgi:hypothetical protein